MDWLVQHWVAVVLFAGYTTLLIFHARTGLKASDTMGEYFVGGRRFGGAVIGISFFATFASTNSYIGHAGKGYTYGAPWLVFAALIVLATWLSWRLVGPRLRYFTSALESVTVPDFLAVRFASPRLRALTGLVVAFSSLLYLIAIFKGAGNLFQVFLGIPYTSAVGVTLVIVMAYTSVGGFHSVVRTDVVQGILMVVGSVLIFGFVTHAAGGIASVTTLFDRPDTEHLFSLNAELPFAVLFGIAMAGSLKLLVDPRQLSRYYGLKDASGLRAGIWIAVVGILLIQFSLFPVGLYARMLLEGVSDTDLVVPMLVNDANVFPTFVADFLVVAITAAAMSSMDSVLLVAGSVLSRDVVGSFRKVSGSEGVRWSRWGIVGVALAAALIALNPPGDIVEITIFSGSLYAVCFVPTVILGLHWDRGDGVSAVTSILVGITALGVWLALGFDSFIHEVFPALIASIGSYVVMALSRPPVDDPKIREIFAGFSSDGSSDGAATS